MERLLDELTKAQPDVYFEYDDGDYESDLALHVYPPTRPTTAHSLQKKTCAHRESNSETLIGSQTV